ncbi:FAD/NAD(P)-binding protein [Flavobacterium selenitireducens]|uniref:FAD/NAD(P)-binding protein n=1 Tax=Flavobacterium selenitireducens TaxID=2722704 RepID=UPI00168B2120|nr:FAD/NAD(P)-binding protein [Flavobacterium selenitireducens]MBD3581288.1 hypothetical protein [Flavobacterium selenitireducens]
MNTKDIAIIGGGPAAMFMFKRIVESGNNQVRVAIFEKNDRLGAGLPYSAAGANPEHVTNVSANEIPEIYQGMLEWLRSAPASVLERYDIDPQNFSAYKVFPRLLFGRYLSDQFDIFLEKAAQIGIKTDVHLNTAVHDILPQKKGLFKIVTDKGDFVATDTIICSGHFWPPHVSLPSGYFDSPYPPSKLALQINHTVGIKGASLTAIDAIRTLSRHNGEFFKDGNRLRYAVNKDCNDFKMVLHTRNGFLPAVRFHLEDPHLFRQSVLSEAEIAEHRQNNNNFISLDFVFEKNFKELFKDKDPGFYAQIKDLSLEAFVDKMMELREALDPFVLLEAEYEQAEKSIRRKESILWKEQLAVLSFTLNPPAKYFCAEDMLRLQKVLMPLISLIIAFIPQSSCLELLALHKSGRLELIAVGEDGTIEPGEHSGATVTFTQSDGRVVRQHYQTFVDCTGQPHLPIEAFPFKGLLEAELLAPATVEFADKANAASRDNVLYYADKAFLKVPGAAINDHFQVADIFGAAIPNLYIMAVPHIGGYNPDYSGLDFCESASEKVIKTLLPS